MKRSIAEPATRKPPSLGAGRSSAIGNRTWPLRKRRTPAPQPGERSEPGGSPLSGRGADVLPEGWEAAGGSAGHVQRNRAAPPYGPPAESWPLDSAELPYRELVNA